MNTTISALPDRSAGSAIEGFVYQFDYTILEILRATQGATVVVEGLEDVDLVNGDDLTATQVKYLAAQKYSSPRVLRQPILLMLKAFSAGLVADFILHVHFGEGVVPTGFTLDELKDCLTVNRTKPSRIEKLYEPFPEATLEGFIDRLTIRPGAARLEQQSEVFRHLAQVIGCSPQEAAELHYGNALAKVQALAMAKDPLLRTISRTEFVTAINKRESLYTSWHRQVVGDERYLLALARKLKASRSLAANKSKVLIIDVDRDADRSKLLASLIELLAKDHFGPRKLTTTKPWSVVLVGDDWAVRNLKVTLLQMGLSLNDGYEEILFQPDLFARPPVINSSNGTLITKTSFDVRVIRAENFQALLESGHVFDSVVVTTSGSHATHVGGIRTEPIEISGLDVSKIQRLLELSR